MPNVSINIPVYNCQQYLAKTLDSVLAQTYQDWECVVVDDASTDGTAALADAYAARERRIRVHRIRPEDKTHYPGSRNVAMRLSTGRWIAPLDGDDWWEPWKLERQVAQSESRPGIVLCCAAAWIWRDGKVVEQFKTAQDGRIWRAMQVANMTIHSGVLIDRQAMLAVGGYRPEMHFCDDWDLWLRLSRKFGKRSLTSLTEPVLYYRRHAGNMSWSVGEHFRWVVFRESLRYCGWGLRRPLLAYKTIDYTFDATARDRRFVKQYKRAVPMAALAVATRPMSVGRWRLLGAVMREGKAKEGKAKKEGSSL